MADKKKYLAVHSVRHDGKLVQRGETLLLTDEHALRLLDRGVISTEKATTVIVVSGPSTAESLASFTKLNGMTKPELVEYARSTYGLELGDDKKEALVAAIHERYVNAYIPAEIEA